MFDKENSKEEVKKLIDKYNRLVESGKLKSYNEEMTKKDFILPLFRALGWSIEDGEEVTAEEKISKGRVDYGFRIESIPKLFLEAKALKVNLAKVEFAEQAINYAWHKGATWAILTDFEGVKVFNAEWKSANPLQNMFFSLNCNQFLDRFDQLLLLSRESLEKGLIDKEAEKWGKKAKKIPIDKQLLNDLTNFRELLTKNIMKNNSKKDLTSDELDEAVQRILDRLIFIRTLEDRELEAPVLQALIREDQHKKVHKKLNSLFRKIDDIYNSKLFRLHLCEELVIDDEILEKIIRGLFKTADNTVHYDFGAIDADVLGNMYEQYLGHILKKTAKRAKLTSGKVHRKEQGIYYTPTYVVDYIVKNTVGEVAKNKKFDLKNIKILDPACGSGSFLMKAFDYLVNLDKQKNKNIDQTKLDLTGASATYGKKVEILKNNIFGVDLDPKAVEIAQLNLLLKAAEKKHRLPTLQENIKVGNSLIDDSTVSKRAFKWGEEFKKIIDDGGFDVVIGNPPYVIYKSSEIPKNTLLYYQNKFSSCQYNVSSYSLFIEKGILLLKEGGHLSFIVPDSFLVGQFYTNLRKVILQSCEIRCLLLVNKDVFEEVTVKSVIIILRKESNEKLRAKNKIRIFKSKKEINLLDLKETTIKQKAYLEDKNWSFTVADTLNRKLVKKIEENSVELEKVIDFFAGLKTDDNKNMIKVDKANPNATREAVFRSVDKKSQIKNWKEKFKKIFGSLDKSAIYNKLGLNKRKELWRPILRGGDIERYSINFKNRYVLYVPELLKSGYDLSKYEQAKIIIRQTGDSLIGCYDNNNFLSMNNTHLILQKNKNFQLKYVLAILNSKLLNFYYHYLVPEKGRTFAEVKIVNLKRLMIKKISKDEQDTIIKMVDNLIGLNQKLEKLKDKTTDEKVRLEKEIQKLDEEIDKEIYKIYELSKEEIEIIEESLR